MSIFLNYVIPSLGVITTALITLSPIREYIKIHTTGDIGSSNPSVVSVLPVNNFAWFLYGLLIKNIYSSLGNLVGCTLSLYYLLVVFSAAPMKVRNRMICIVTCGFAAVLTANLISFIYFADTNIAMARMISGSIGNIFFVVFCSAPFSIIKKAIQMRDGSYFSFPLALTNGINGLLWTVYGSVLEDWILTAPSLVGVISSLTQLLIIFSFRKPKLYESHKKLPDSVELDSVEGVIVKSIVANFLNEEGLIQRSVSIRDIKSTGAIVSEAHGWKETELQSPLPWKETHESWDSAKNETAVLIETSQEPSSWNETHDPAVPVAWEAPESWTETIEPVVPEEWMETIEPIVPADYVDPIESNFPETWEETKESVTTWVDQLQEFKEATAPLMFGATQEVPTIENLSKQDVSGADKSEADPGPNELLSLEFSSADDRFLEILNDEPVVPIVLQPLSHTRQEFESSDETLQRSWWVDKKVEYD